MLLVYVPIAMKNWPRALESLQSVRISYSAVPYLFNQADDSFDGDK